MDSIHELMGGTGQVGGNEARQHVNKVFETMDLNEDGYISVDEFLTYCTSQQEVKESLTVSILRKRFRKKFLFEEAFGNRIMSNSRCKSTY